MARPGVWTDELVLPPPEGESGHEGGSVARAMLLHVPRVDIAAKLSVESMREALLELSPIEGAVEHDGFRVGRAARQQLLRAAQPMRAWSSGTSDDLIVHEACELSPRRAVAQARPRWQEPVVGCGVIALSPLGGGGRRPGGRAPMAERRPVVKRELQGQSRGGGDDLEALTERELVLPPRKIARGASRAKEAAPTGVDSEIEVAAREGGAAGLLDDVDQDTLDALVVAREAMRACQVPSRPRAGWGSSAAREEAFIANGARALADRLPEEMQLRLAGGPQAVAQMGGTVAAAAMAAAVLRTNAGRDGGKLYECLKAIAYIEGFARAKGQPAWPVSTGLAWLLVAGEHVRATRDAKGKRGGASVGDRLRGLFIFMNKIRMPIEVDKVVLASAAPAPSSAGNNDGSAATIPPLWWCQIEHVAAGSGASPQRFWARSILLAGLGVSLRVADGVRVKLAMGLGPHGEDVVVVDAKLPSSSASKDGISILAFATTEGLLGPLTWAPSHVRDCAELGQVFPAWDGPRGCQGNFALATSLKREVVNPSKIMRPLAAVVADAPACVSAEEMEEVGARGHSFHGTPSDLAAVVGPAPSLPFIVEDRDKPGFDRAAVNGLGHWLRLHGAVHDERPADDVVRAAVTGVGRAAGTANTRADQVGRYQRGTGRDGDKVTQLKLRSRLVRIMRAAIAHYAPEGWWKLPRGALSRLILAPV